MRAAGRVDGDGVAGLLLAGERLAGAFGGRGSLFLRGAFRVAWRARLAGAFGG